ncbi:MAG: acetyl-CoA carboxylase carboxyltransferase subunit alpha [Gammaproteobacteria bacterium]|jgi:acetyl-CoA carboxylase carboxyl transferase subunit alpha|nr:MAG: acetyl-CoA carboxylase carboxyltransferase subunit alpha [Gammaproteobacteria bacterium]|tara:strand:- start:1849 stop:2796 length:948 start_codon:yes stop_codon:yes gene_type:complete
MAYTYLEFEKPISDLESKIEKLRISGDVNKDIESEISKLSSQIEKLTEEVYSNLSIWQKVQVARHPHRPHFSDYIENVFSDFDELHGDRVFGEDKAIIGGLARFKKRPVVIVGQEKGKSTEDKISRNFGMAQPEGYRKTARLMKMAEDFDLPLISFIDTPGAYPGIESEERGMSEAIAKNLSLLSNLKTPVIVIITGEGGSGGALAIGVGDHVCMLEHSIYAVASPEACASIVWRDGSKAKDAAEAMKVDASSLQNLGLVDQVIKEPLGGAHRDLRGVSNSISQVIEEKLLTFDEIDISDLLDKRYEKIMSYGSI